MKDFINVNYQNRSYIIYKGDSLKTILKNTELLNIPMNKWKDIFEEKDGKCFYNLLYRVLEEKINYYDTSDNINSFYYKNNKYWYSKDIRVGLLNLANCSSDNMVLVLGDNLIELNTDKVKNFLSLLEVYAGKCFVNTKKHLSNIKLLKTIEDLINYDYTTGYPEKIILNEK